MRVYSLCVEPESRVSLRVYRLGDCLLCNPVLEQAMLCSLWGRIVGGQVSDGDFVRAVAIRVWVLDKIKRIQVVK